MKVALRRHTWLSIWLICLLLPLTVQAIERKTWNVDGIEREALLAAPATAKDKSTPLVFVFHGHGGTAQHASRVFDLDSLWPEAIVVYMQGLRTPGHITDPEGKRTGWQRYAGDQNDRDLQFFDAVLASLKKDYKIDTRRIYSTGHSNGGAFTYLLWAERGSVFAAMAPSGAAAPKHKRIHAVLIACATSRGTLHMGHYTSVLRIYHFSSTSSLSIAWFSDRSATASSIITLHLDYHMLVYDEPHFS